MPRRLQTWRFTFWTALVPTLLLTLAAATNLLIDYGLVGPSGHFLCWTDGSISLGVNSLCDELEPFADFRPDSTARNQSTAAWTRLMADQRIDIPAWLAPLPTLGICVLAYQMTRVPLIPRCRKCRYDLRGLSPDKTGKLTCPECGAESRP